METVTLDMVIRAVAAQAGLTRHELRDPEEKAYRVSRARHLAWLIVSRLRPDLSLQVIGRRFGRKHAAVLQGIEKAEARLVEGEAGFLADLAEVLNDLLVTELPARPNTATRAIAGVRTKLRAAELRVRQLKDRLAAMEGAQL